MPKILNIRYNGYEAEVVAYASRVEDLPALMCDASNALNALLPVEEPDSDGEVACCSHLTEAAAPTAGFGANGAILAKLDALLQVAIANAPQLISEISAIIAMFGGTVPSPTAGFGANGAILAKLDALLQVAIANAPQLISEISAIIAMFGGTVPSPTPSPSTAA